MTWRAWGGRSRPVDFSRVWGPSVFNPLPKEVGEHAAQIAVPLDNVRDLVEVDVVEVVLSCSVIGGIRVGCWLNEDDFGLRTLLFLELQSFDCLGPAGNNSTE